MAIKMFTRVAVTVSVAGALELSEKADATAKWAMDSDLPRAVLQTNDMENSGCGKEVPGYFMIESLLWESSWPSKAFNTSQCAEQCDKNTDCVGFSSRQPNRGRLQCNLYKGLHKKLHRGMSFVRCVPGFECQKGLPGFKFSHAGTWRDGRQIAALDDMEVEACAMECHKNRACVGITYFVGHDEDKYCFHFENEDNKGGPRRDMRAYSYSKCAAQSVEKIPEDGMRLLESLALKKAENAPGAWEE